MELLRATVAFGFLVPKINWGSLATAITNRNNICIGLEYQYIFENLNKINTGKMSMGTKSNDMTASKVYYRSDYVLFFPSIWIMFNYSKREFHPIMPLSKF